MCACVFGFFATEHMQNCLKPRLQSCLEPLTVSRLQWMVKTGIPAPALVYVPRVLQTCEKVCVSVPHNILVGGSGERGGNGFDLLYLKQT